jgi:hypothetical protein
MDENVRSIIDDAVDKSDWELALSLSDEVLAASPDAP